MFHDPPTQLSGMSKREDVSFKTEPKRNGNKVRDVL